MRDGIYTKTQPKHVQFYRHRFMVWLNDLSLEVNTNLYSLQFIYSRNKNTNKNNRILRRTQFKLSTTISHEF